MKLFFGIVFSAVILVYASHLLIQAIKRKKIVPLAIFLGLLGVYALSFYNELAFYVFWNLLLIPQILFTVYVFVFMIVSLTRKKTNTKVDTSISDDDVAFVSIVIAVHNEENVVANTVNNLLNLEYPKDKYDITFIDDFSKDSTLEVLLKYKDQIQVIDRSKMVSNAQIKGKPAAVNENINKLKGALICILDADSVIEKEFLKRIVPKFQNPNLGIVQARNVFYNKDKNIMTRLTALDIYSMQHTIYIPVSRLGFGMFEGRAGVFRKKIFEDIGGFDPSLPGEDFDFAYRVGLLGYKVEYDDSVFSKEQVTETVHEWFKQRKRWLANHVLSCFKNLKGLYQNENLTVSRKIAALFFMLNLLYAFTFNFFGPLILINEFKYDSVLPYVFIISFSLTVVFFCFSYILRTRKLWLIPLIPIMIFYYWTFTVIQTWVLINEKLIKIKLSYKKAFIENRYQMKSNILFLALFISLFGFSQETKWDLNLEGVATTKGIFSYTVVGYNFTKIKIQSGILLGTDYINNGTVLGIQGDVMYFPNGVNKKAFNFLFIGSLNYFNTKVALNFSEVTTNFIQGTLGYGFTYFLNEKLSIKNNIGLGILLENRKFNFNTNDPVNKWGFAGILSLGITYKL